MIVQNFMKIYKIVVFLYKNLKITKFYKIQPLINGKKYNFNTLMICISESKEARLLEFSAQLEER